MVEETERNAKDKRDFWTDRQQVGSVLLFGLTFLILCAFGSVIQPFFKALIWSLALAISIHPFHRWMESHFKRADVAAAITVFIVGLAILAPIIFVTSEIINQASMLVRKVQSPEFQEGMEKFLRDYPQLSSLKSPSDVGEEIKGIASTVAGSLPKMASGMIWKLTEAGIVLLILFFFFRDRLQFLVATRRHLPLSDRECDQLYTRVENTVRATVYGHLFMALIQGTLGGLVFWAVGLPAPLLWGTVMTILAVLPILGAAIVWIPAAAFLMFQGAWGKALILVIFGSVIIGLIDNLLYPYLVGRRIQEHTLLVFLSLVGGIIVFGAAGIIAGPLLLALTDALIEIWRGRTAPNIT